MSNGIYADTIYLIFINVIKKDNVSQPINF